MIDGIELDLFDEVEQVRKLKCGYAVGIEQFRKSFGKIIDIRHMGEDIVGRHEIRLLPRGSKARGEFRAKKFLDRIDAFEACCCCCAGGRLNAKTFDAPVFDILEEITIVGSDLDNQALAAEREAFDHLLDIGFRVLEPLKGERAEVGVFLIKKFRRAGVGLGLHKPAGVANDDFKRKPFFRPTLRDMG